MKPIITTKQITRANKEILLYIYMENSSDQKFKKFSRHRHLPLSIFLVLKSFPNLNDNKVIIGTCHIHVYTLYIVSIVQFDHNTG